MAEHSDHEDNERPPAPKAVRAAQEAIQTQTAAAAAAALSQQALGEQLRPIVEWVTAGLRDQLAGTLQALTASYRHELQLAEQTGALMLQAYISQVVADQQLQRALAAELARVTVPLDQVVTRPLFTAWLEQISATRTLGQRYVETLDVSGRVDMSVVDVYRPAPSAAPAVSDDPANSLESLQVDDDQAALAALLQVLDGLPLGWAMALVVGVQLALASVGGYAAYSSEEWARAIGTGIGVLQTPAAWLISLALIYAVLANRRPPQDPE